MKCNSLLAAKACVAACCCCLGCQTNSLQATVERLESQLAVATEQLKLAHGQVESATAIREASAKTYEDKLAAERQRSQQLEKAVADTKGEALAHAEVASQRAMKLTAVARENADLKRQLEELRNVPTKREEEPSPEGVWVYSDAVSHLQLYRVVFSETSVGTGRWEEWSIRKTWSNRYPAQSNLFRYTVKPDGVVEILTAQEGKLLLRFLTANEGWMTDPSDPIKAGTRGGEHQVKMVRVKDDWVPNAQRDLPNPEPALPINKPDNSR
jgi:hypothetical protein